MLYLLAVSFLVEYHIYSNIPAAGLAFQPKKKGGIIGEAGILERWDYFFNALMSSLRVPFHKQKTLKNMSVANQSMQFEEGSKRMFQKNNKAQALH